MHYTTEGDIGPISGLVASTADNTNPGPPLQFQGIDNGNFDQASPFSLGQFVIGKGVSSYVDLDNARFLIRFHIPSLNRVGIDSGPPGLSPSYSLKTYYDPSFTISGHLSGGINHGQPNLTATIDQISPLGGGPFPADGMIKSGLPFSIDNLLIPKTFAINSVGSDGRTSPLMAQVVPEPAPMMLFLAAIVGYATRSRWRRWA